MPVIREWRCGDCGTLFESMAAPEEVDCPTCSAAEPERVFLTPPAIRSPQTNFKDATVKQLAADYGLSDVSNKHGEAVKKAPSGAEMPAFANPSNSPIVQKLAASGGVDGFSQVLPTLRRAGGPRNWARTPVSRK